MGPARAGRPAKKSSPAFCQLSLHGILPAIFLPASSVVLSSYPRQED